MLIGVVGKPSVGKSTFFKAATLAEAEIAPYPFTTIKPNSGVGYAKIDCVDAFFNKQCNPRDGYCLHHKRFVPVQMLDVAGLVPGAHEGKGMGNQFLDDLRQADVLIHVIDVAGSTNEKGENVEPGSYDPAEDIKFLEVELDMWYLGIIKKGWEKFVRTVMQEKGKVAFAITKQLSGLKVRQEMVEEVIEKLDLVPEHLSSWSEDQLKQMAVHLRKKTKPMVIACNKIDMVSGESNFQRLKKMFPDYLMIPCSSESELALREAARKEIIDYVAGQKTFTIKKEEMLNDAQKKALQFIQGKILDKYGSTGVQDTLDIAVFKLLHCVAVFPGGVNNLVDQHGNCLPDCFLMPSQSTALDFAFRLHTDFGKNFIRALNVKTKKPIGKDYVLQQGDVVEIVSGK